MKTGFWRCSSRLFAASVAVFLLKFSGASPCHAGQPIIASIQPEGTNIVVEVNLPAGFERITLESRARFGSGNWAPLAVGQNDGTATKMRFRVACSRALELLRVRADARQALPKAFYTGPSSFSGPTNATMPGPVATAGGPGTANGPSGSDTTRAVVESDIWQIAGDTIYFFNQYRGLQIIDIASPDQAKVIGTLNLPAAGERMYLPDSSHVALIANNTCSGDGQSQVYVVSVAKGVPVVVTNLSLGGWYQDSRMVGTALYVACQSYRPVEGSTNTVWEWGTTVSSFDLSQPEQPMLRSRLWFGGYGNVVSATETYLFIATQDPRDWWKSKIQIIDITAPDGTMNTYDSVSTAGRVQDKFKLNYTNGVFTTISEDWRTGTTNGPVTRLETFHLPDPRSAGPATVTKLGELELGSGERLHATRFDGDRVYVVTFFQIDPLWVVDLSDPVYPHVSGSVDVAGWSSYIQPLGDRLVTVGVESHRVAVSLFDVKNPGQPTLLSRVLLGENYSWSEADYDEKAFTVLPEQGLVLVPYNGDTTNGWTTQVQLIDLTDTNLVARGIIEHQCQPRRTAYAQDRILSLSGWELLSVDASDRDHPRISGKTELAWPVDRLILHDDYLLQLSSASSWFGFQSVSSLRVSPAHQTEFVLTETDLGDLPVVGSTVNGDRLYVAQAQSYFYPILANGPGDAGGDPGTNVPNFVVTVLDVSRLPQVAILGRTSLTVDTAPWGGNWTAVWPKADVLVWVGGGSALWWAVPMGGGVTAAGGVGFWPWWGAAASGQLLAFNVDEPKSPAFLSEVNLTTNGWWNFTQPFLTGTKVYLSHSQLEPQTNSSYPQGFWTQLYQLDVIDYADASSPVVRSPVTIPGNLQGLSYGGELLYTTGPHWKDGVTDWTDWLDASAYDGVEAHLIASQQLAPYWPHPVLVVDTNVFVGRPSYSETTTNLTLPLLQTWSLSTDGTFRLDGSIGLSQSATSLLERNGLLAAQLTDNSLAIFDDSSPAHLFPLTSARSDSCVYYDLRKADGTRETGLWLPLGDYGIKEIPLSP